MSSPQLSKQDIVRILPVNALLYDKTAASSPVVERTQKKSFAEGGGSTVFSAGDRMIINMQTGTEFVDPLQSFLVFDINADAGIGYIIGSILNFIAEAQISSRSGKELDRCEHLNLLNYHRLKAAEPDFQSHGLQAMVMFNDSPTKANIDARAQLTATAKRVMIPLKYISGLFDSEKLMPPHLARGLRIDCLLEQLNTAIVEFGLNTVTSYEIRKPYILHDSYRMADSVLEYLNAEFASKKTGLVYEFNSFHTTNAVTSTASLNVEVRRSVSMAIDAFAVTRPDANKANKAADSFASAVAEEGDRSQWRIGSHYLPNQDIVGVIEHYTQMLYHMGALRNDKPVGTSYAEFVGDGDFDAAKANFGQAKFPVTLQRNNILDLSGLAINNSTTLEVNGTLGGVAAAKLVQVYLRHLRRAVCFMESITLET
jgi:hypothetical protein